MFYDTDSVYEAIRDNVEGPEKEREDYRAYEKKMSERDGVLVELNKSIQKVALSINDLI